MTNIPLTGDFKVTCEFGRAGSWAAGFHTGIDLVSDNLNIYSSCNGTVVRTGYDKSYGNFVVVRNDDDGKYHWFCHLSKKKVVKNQRVDRISILGIMGSTGNSTGRHLHFEIRNESNVYADVENPANYMGIPNKVGNYNTSNFPIYRSHIQDIGWQNFVPPFMPTGTTGQARRLEAFQIMSDDVKYRVHLQDIGWTGFYNGGDIAGTTGESRRLEAIEFKSDKEMMAQAHIQDIGWQPIQQGKQIMIGTEGKSLRLEAFKFIFV